MKEIKIKLVGFWDGFDPAQNVIFQILNKHFHVVFCDDADYVFCSVFGTPYEYCQYPQVRIMFSGENYIPDFNLIDYAICPYPIEFLDRCVYNPMCFDDPTRLLSLQTKDRKYPSDIIKSKEFFANFIAGHESENNIRGDFFKELSKYKRVESAGTYLNNMPGGFKVDFSNSSKTDFQKKCKFTLCFESTKHNGFITEKIVDAYYSDTIPIYYGSDTISDIFNPLSFINCSDFENFDDAIKYIISLDKDDSKFLEMLQQPIFNKHNMPSLFLDNLEKFLLYIFNQPIESAYRRSRVYSPKRHENYIINTYSPNTMAVLDKFAKLNATQQSSNISNTVKVEKKYLRALLRSAKRNRPFPFIKKNYWIYENAYPTIMKLYWFLIAIKNKIVKKRNNS